MNIGFEQTNAKATTVDWITPEHIIQSFEPFDLDPCTPSAMPWNTAAHRYTEVEDGLKQPWHGRVWLNPPYGDKVMRPWLEKMAEHGNGIALIPARMETRLIHHVVLPNATAIFFKEGRIQFYTPDGIAVNGNGVGSLFVAYGRRCAEWLENPKNFKGQYIRLRP